MVFEINWSFVAKLVDPSACIVQKPKSVTFSSDVVSTVRSSTQTGERQTKKKRQVKNTTPQTAEIVSPTSKTVQQPNADTTSKSEAPSDMRDLTVE